MEHQNDNLPNVTIFIDTDAFVAFVKENDTNHGKAVELFAELEKLPVQFTTSNYVYAEALTVISQRVGHAIAIQFSENVKSPDSFVVMKRLTEELDTKSFGIFKQQTSKNVSFVDCTNMALMDEIGIEYIFSFDGAYKTNGYRTVEDLLQSNR